VVHKRAINTSESSIQASRQYKRVVNTSETSIQEKVYLSIRMKVATTVELLRTKHVKEEQGISRAFGQSSLATHRRRHQEEISGIDGQRPDLNA
jgi:hypothetical protein